MKLFKKREAPSRRSTRLWLLRFRKLGLILAAIAMIGGASWYAVKNGTLGKTALWIHDKTLSTTAGMGFRVRDIIIIGRHRTEARELLAALGIRQGDAIFGANIDAAQAKLSEISWAKEVSITRRLPDAIIIDLKEREPVALWQYQKKISVIDGTGRALTSKNLDKYRDLPLVVGEDAPLHVEPLLDLLRAEPEIAKEITSAVRIGGRRWDLRLNNGLTVKLPEQDTELALRKLATQQDKNALFAKNISAIDLRIPDQMVVEPLPEPEPKKTI
ncbi:MAG TPA: cell division protein FtsQ/DivIB [Patescibacteria group bacterium]|nr:cell division protein FtsQ/DivIB [Patescibacteria group bacterium]